MKLSSPAIEGTLRNSGWCVRAALALALAGLAGCGDDSGSSADAAPDVDAQPAPLCLPTPSRFIVLGDSIQACVTVNGKDSDDCAAKILHSNYDSSLAPGITYENVAVGGAVTADVPENQLPVVTTGEAGHVVVMIYIGGNDLQTYLPASDEVAMQGLIDDLPGIRANWEEIFAFFDDTAKFPDGATILMNNQYNPFDDCTEQASGIALSAAKNQLLRDFNSALQEIADQHDNAFLTDQFTTYLGHGHNYAAEACPHYAADSVPFMADLIHPNEAGNAHLAARLALTKDTLYAGCE